MNAERGIEMSGTQVHLRGPADEDGFFGRMNDPSGSAFVRGLCGDEMEFYLVIEDKTITEVKYYTEGCSTTGLCGLAVAKRVKGRSISDALGISPREIIDCETSLPEEGRHCAILAVSALYYAIADYLLTS